MPNIKELLSSAEKLLAEARTKIENAEVDGAVPDMEPIHRLNAAIDEQWEILNGKKDVLYQDLLKAALSVQDDSYSQRHPLVFGVGSLPGYRIKISKDGVTASGNHGSNVMTPHARVASSYGFFWEACEGLQEWLTRYAEFILFYKARDLNTQSKKLQSLVEGLQRLGRRALQLLVA